MENTVVKDLHTLSFDLHNNLNSGLTVGILVHSKSTAYFQMPGWDFLFGKFIHISFAGTTYLSSGIFIPTQSILSLTIGKVANH